MRIVIIQGLGRLDSGLEQTIAEAFRERYPKASISIEGLWFGLYWQQGRLRRLVNDIVEKYDHDGTETMLIGHSVGGNVVLACERYFINSHILGMATICAPLQSEGTHDTRNGPSVGRPVRSAGSDGQREGHGMVGNGLPAAGQVRRNVEDHARAVAV